MLENTKFSAFLFDMDGTLINSIAAAERVWTHWARRHGLDVDAFLPTIHGVRCIETIRRQNLPGVDPEREAEAVTQAEMDDVEGVVAIEGAAAFLASLPAHRWAVVTSAPRALAEKRMRAAGLPLPALMIASEDVTQGKPAPDCFLLAAQRLGVNPSDCLVFEDAPAGIEAAEKAGASVMVISAAHVHPYQTAHPTLNRYTNVRAQVDGETLTLASV
ncbi:HAD family hydrolase [Pseudomonas huanghezhanensis]|uniref:HAD family hydrolase n=1 Tax=Pseudomonas huanghezhanensis TaxID=3002903 RepID=UPI0022865658|nr:HAD family hydrolase [Pseudomonas sp. BSw22131]